MSRGETVQLLVFGLLMLVAALLSLRAARSSTAGLEPRDPRRLRRSAPPVLVSLVALVVFPWGVVA